ncbi:MAG: hypothetical protein WCH04_07720 [Gammaproteobacteria bacterium]
MNTILDWRLKASIFFYSLFLLFTVTFSVTYLFRSEFMPWHVAIAEQNWVDISLGMQSLILGLMKALGGAWLSTAVAISILLVKSIRQGIRWAYWAIPAIGLPPAVINLFIGINEALNTSGSPPWVLPAFAVLILIAGFILFLISEDK